MARRFRISWLSVAVAFQRGTAHFSRATETEERNKGGAGGGWTSILLGFYRG